MINGLKLSWEEIKARAIAGEPLRWVHRPIKNSPNFSKKSGRTLMLGRDVLDSDEGYMVISRAIDRGEVVETEDSVTHSLCYEFVKLY